MHVIKDEFLFTCFVEEISVDISKKRFKPLILSVPRKKEFLVCCLACKHGYIYIWPFKLVKGNLYSEVNL